MSEPRYRKNTGSVFNLHLHLVWCPKYRKPVLVDAVETRLRQLLLEKAAALNVEVQGLEILPDHVHLFIAVPPTDAPQHYANQFKGYTSRVLRQEFEHLRTRLPSLWSRSYYVGSETLREHAMPGHVSVDAIKKYIEAQKTRA